MSSDSSIFDPIFGSDEEDLIDTDVPLFNATPIDSDSEFEGSYYTPDASKIVDSDPYAFMWTIGVNLCCIVAAYFFVLYTRQRPGFWRSVYFPRLLKVRIGVLKVVVPGLLPLAGVNLISPVEAQ